MSISFTPRHRQNPSADEIEILRAAPRFVEPEMMDRLARKGLLRISGSLTCLTARGAAFREAA